MDALNNNYLHFLDINRKARLNQNIDIDNPQPLIDLFKNIVWVKEHSAEAKDFCLLLDILPLSESAKKLQQFLKENHPDLFAQDMITVSLADEHVDVLKQNLLKHSNFFETMLKNSFAETKSGKIDLKHKFNNESTELEKETAKAFLNYLKTGQIDLSSIEDIWDLLFLAKAYEVKELTEKCSIYLFNAIDKNSIENILSIAKTYELEDLLLSCYVFIVINRGDFYDFIKTNRDFIGEKYKAIHELVKICKDFVPDAVNKEILSATNPLDIHRVLLRSYGYIRTNQNEFRNFLDSKDENGNSIITDAQKAIVKNNLDFLEKNRDKSDHADLSDLLDKAKKFDCIPYVMSNYFTIEKFNPDTIDFVAFLMRYTNNNYGIWVSDVHADNSEFNTIAEKIPNLKSLKTNNNLIRDIPLPWQDNLEKFVAEDCELLRNITLNHPNVTISLSGRTNPHATKRNIKNKRIAEVTKGAYASLSKTYINADQAETITLSNFANAKISAKNVRNMSLSNCIDLAINTDENNTAVLPQVENLTLLKSGLRTVVANEVREFKSDSSSDLSVNSREKDTVILPKAEKVDIEKSNFSKLVLPKVKTLSVMHCTELKIIKANVVDDLTLKYCPNLEQLVAPAAQVDRIKNAMKELEILEQETKRKLEDLRNAIIVCLDRERSEIIKSKLLDIMAFLTNKKWEADLASPAKIRSEPVYDVFKVEEEFKKLTNFNIDKKVFKSPSNPYHRVFCSKENAIQRISENFRYDNPEFPMQNIAHFFPDDLKNEILKTLREIRLLEAKLTLLDYDNKALSKKLNFDLSKDDSMSISSHSLDI